MLKCDLTLKSFVVKCKFYWAEEKYRELFADGKPEDWINFDGPPGKIGDEWDNQEDKFRFYITTRHLIEFSSNFKLVLQTDGIYKLT